MLLESGLTEEQQDTLNQQVSKLLDETPIQRNAEHRLVALLLVVWNDAEQSGITPMRLAAMAMKAFSRMNEKPTDVTKTGDA